MTLYGRGPALEALRGNLAAARAGRGRLAVISGEAGIGKSALVELLAAEAEASGAVVSRGRAWEFADAPPYFPVRACLRGLGVRVERDAGGPSDAGSFQLWEDVVAALARAATEALQVWVLEDLHAADLGTLDLLTFLAQPLRSLRAVVLATARPHDPRLADRSSQRLARMARDGADVRLERLGPRDLAGLAEATAGRALPPHALARLADVTGGNPLFVVECARLLGSEGEWTSDAAPATVRHVVLERCGLLPESARRALVSGAILGRSFSAASVGRMHQLLPAQVIDALLPALRADLVAELRPGQFQFSHALVRDALEASLEEDERAALHARAAEALAALGDAPDVLLERARHALAGARRGGDDRALELVARAGAALEREGALDRAYELYARADEARASGLLPPATGDERLRLATVARLAGRADASRLVCQQVAARARADGDPGLLARAALLEGADLRPGVVDRGLVAHLEEALAAVAALGDPARALSCRVEARLAAALQPAANPEVPMAMARRALAKVRALGDDALLLDVLEVAGSALVDFAPPEERRALAEELLALALRAGDSPKALRAQARAALDQMELGDFDAFERTADAMLALSDEVGHPRHRWRALLVASCRALTLGYFRESERHVSEASHLGALTDDPALALALCAHRALRVRLTRHDDELPSALADLERSMSGVPQAELVAALVRATCLARVEDADATRRELTLIGSRAAGLATDRTFCAWLAEAYALAGTESERAGARAWLASAQTADVAGGHIPFTYEGTVARLRGLLDASLGDPGAAERHLAEARALAVQRRHAPWVAQLDHERGKVARQAGREADARALFAAASAAATELGMTGLARAARGQLERATAAAGATTTAATTTTTPAPAPGPSEIQSAREGELWRFSRGPTTVRIRASRGAQLLARLLERPGEELHVLALASDEPGRQEGDTSAGELLDERARASYRARVASLDEDLAEAERCADVGRAAVLSREREALMAELARAVGLGGRSRSAGSASERARVNVQRRLRDTIARITELDADLGRSLNDSVRTGIYCCFRP